MINEIANQLKKQGYMVLIENNKIYTQHDGTNNTQFEKTVKHIVEQYNGGDQSKIAVNLMHDCIGQRLIEINMDPVRKFNIFGGVYYA